MEYKKEEIKGYLNNLGREEMEDEILRLCEYFEDVKQYYSYKVNPGVVQELLSGYEDNIENAMKNMDFATCKGLIETFQKICTDKLYVAALKFFYAETALYDLNEMSKLPMDASYHILEAYERALQYIFAEGLEETFGRRAREIVNDGANSFWSITEGLKNLYQRYFNNMED